MGFDYLWLSNGLGFSSNPWKKTGKIFDGEKFHPEKLDSTSKKVFDFCAKSATTADLLIYIGPSGCDAWAEIGAAYGSGVNIFGLLAKNEEVGIMRHMIKDINKYMIKD